MTRDAVAILLALIQPLTRDEAQAAIGVAPGAALLELVDGGLIERVVVAGQPDRFQRTPSGETRALVEDEPVEEPAPAADGLRVTARTEEGGDPSGRIPVPEAAPEKRPRGPGKAAGELAALRQGLVEALTLAGPETDAAMLERVRRYATAAGEGARLRLALADAMRVRGESDDNALIAEAGGNAAALQAARLTLAGMRAGLADEPAALPEGWVASATYVDPDLRLLAKVVGRAWAVTIDGRKIGEGVVDEPGDAFVYAEAIVQARRVLAGR